MVQINFSARSVTCKLVYCGPGRSGKTTNLKHIHKIAPKDTVGNMASIETEDDRTIYFDYLPVNLGDIAGLKTRFQIYTVPGQVYYRTTRKAVLQGVDGVIFVADSDPDKMQENIESLEDLKENLREMRLQVDNKTAPGYIPLVIQYNKRDLPLVMTIEQLNEALNENSDPFFEANAIAGEGVIETLRTIAKLVLDRANKQSSGREVAKSRKIEGIQLEKPETQEIHRSSGEISENAAKKTKTASHHKIHQEEIPKVDHRSEDDDVHHDAREEKKTVGESTVLNVVKAQIDKQNKTSKRDIVVTVAIVTVSIIAAFAAGAIAVLFALK